MENSQANPSTQERQRQADRLGLQSDFWDSQNCYTEKEKQIQLQMPAFLDTKMSNELVEKHTS